MLFSLALSFGVLALIAVLAFAIYDLCYFVPRRGEIDAILSLATPSEKQPSRTLVQLLELESDGDPSRFASRQLLLDLQVPHTRSVLGRHAADLLWQQLVRLHLSDRERLTIICSRGFLGRRAHGFDAGAKAWFGKPLDALDETELATLVVLQRWPTYYGQPENADHLLKARDDLLTRKRAAISQHVGSPP